MLVPREPGERARSTDMIDPSTLAALTTEQRNPAYAEMDLLDISSRCALQNQADQEVAKAVERELKSIARAVEMIVRAIHRGGRLIYVGAGTSGRLGVLDAAECPPTFGTDPSLVQAIIAGGETALTRAVEGVEDDNAAGAAALREKGVSGIDCVVGIAASGRTPFVLAALKYARSVGATTIGLTNNRPAEIEGVADLSIAVVVGPEIVSGSTRLKAGTAQKLVLNMLTTQTMIELGKTYGDIMVDVMATNAKLKARARRIVHDITGVDDKQVIKALDQANGSAKLAALMLRKDLNPDSARSLLSRNDGLLRKAIDDGSETE